MNPSASGWIRKHLPVFQERIVVPNFSEEQFYSELKKIGFIYANSISTITYPDGKTTYQLTLEEITKINLFDGLGFTFFKLNPKAKAADFVENAVAFYNYLKKNSWFDFKVPFLKTSAESKLEKIIQRRVQTNESVINKNFSGLITNALLYLDVLTFEHFLKNEKNPIDYAKSMEALLANTIYLAMKKKSDKTEHEIMVLKLLESSIRYNKVEEVSLSYDDLNYKKHKLPLECLYILDLACMSVYADELLEEKEQDFIQKLAKNIGLNAEKTAKSISEVKTFMTENKDKISYLGDGNPFKNLYNKTSGMVSTLLVRNKKRLSIEIKQSKELMVLLAKSTKTNLTEEEKTKVKNQLLDICKVVPSLGIFILPGGSILLPIMIKLIPDILPSAFEDNK